jgi:phthiocerol/phenolphthiocerol synthesis type-I polyketide synthase E
VLSGRSSVARFDDIGTHPDYVPVHGVIEGYDTFDAKLFGYSPREAQTTDPQQRKFLECAFEALERAGHPRETVGRSFGVVAGVGNNSYFVNNLLPDAALRADWNETAMFVASEKDHVATRVAHRLDLTGPAWSVQTSCSTSLVAVHLACRALQTGDADLMLAGGSTIQVPHEAGHVFTPHGIASRDGTCRPFDVAASGTVFGSGFGVVALRRLDDAIADGDPILGVIAGSATNNDGSRKVGYAAPSGAGQVEVLSRALEETGVDPARIGYVETHGIGAELGDAVEFEALRAALDGDDRPACVLGTLKAQVGHLDSAAGVAGLIKAMMVVGTGTVPANVGHERPHPQLDLPATRFELSTAAGAWPGGRPRRWAGVSSFGLGGANAHVLLDEPPRTLLLVLADCGATRRASRQWPDPRGGAGRSRRPPRGARAVVRRRGRPGADPATAPARVPFRAAVVGTDVAGAALRARLSVLRRTVRNARLGFMFTGYGGQWPGTQTGLPSQLPAFAEALADALDDAGLDLPHDLTLAGDLWSDPRTGQPLLFAVQHAVASFLAKVARPADLVVGHSLGEYAAGALDLAGAATLVLAGAEVLAAAAGGEMTSVLAGEDVVTDLLGRGLVVAARNAPGSVVVSGDLEAIEVRAAAASVKTRRLDIHTAAHSPHLGDDRPSVGRPARHRHPGGRRQLLRGGQGLPPPRTSHRTGAGDLRSLGATP